MNNKVKIEKLKALTESVKATQAKLAKAKKLEESLRATNIGVLLEAELEQAEVILAAKDFVSKLQKMAEDLAKMQAESIPLGDSMKETLGPEAAQDFENAVTNAIADGLVAVRAAKDTISDSIGRVEGGNPEGTADLGSDMGDMGGDLGGDTGGDLDLGVDGNGEEMGDVFGGSDAAAGPSEDPLGRGMKESYKAIGQKLLMKESLDSLVNWLMEDVAATMPADQFPKFAGQIAMKGAQDSERLAGWIGKRKYGKGLGAQLSSPLSGMDDDILDEGKSYKRNDDEDNEGKKKADKSKRDAAKGKREIEEGKSFKRDEDEDDVEDKKKADKNKRGAAKAKRSIEEAVRLIIERNIIQTGKGFAAKAIAEAQSMFPMVEGASAESIAEAFEAEFGMSPQAYSVKKARAVREAAPMNPQDKKNTAATMTKLAGEMATDKNLGNKGVQQAMSKMDSKERQTAQKVINNAKSKGSEVKKVDDLVAAAKDELEENINAANWPVNSMGQYKGDAFSTDYNKLSPNKTKSDSSQVKDTPKAADAPKADTKSPMQKEEAPKKEAAPKQEAPKAEDKSEGSEEKKD